MGHPMEMQGQGDMDMRGHADAGSTERPMSHHMVVFGHETVFMSHLPMFSMPEHAYQVILETELTGAGVDPQQIYRQDWEKHSDVRFYTFDPKPFVLSEILPTADNPPQATTFGGDLYRNDLEMDDPPPVQIASRVTVNIKNIVHGRRFDTNAPAPTQLQYILFGRGKDVFLAHLITRPPDFDQLMRVTVTPAFSDGDLSRGLIVTVDGRKNTEDERIQPSEQGSVAATVGTGTTSLNVKIDPVDEFYFNDDSDMQ